MFTPHITGVQDSLEVYVVLAQYTKVDLKTRLIFVTFCSISDYIMPLTCTEVHFFVSGVF